MMKKAQVVMLPAEKSKASFWLDKYNHKLYYNDSPSFSKIGQYLYFTTDDEIKEGDWVIAKNSNLLRLEKVKMVNHLGNNSILLDSGYDVTPNTLLKIIATTNPDLWGYKTTGSHGAHAPLRSTREVVGVPKIPTDFIEAYVREQGKIKEVLIEYDELNQRSADSFDLEVYTSYRLKLRSNGTVIIHRVKEKMYTKQELFEAFISGYANASLPSEKLNQFFDQWFNENHPV